MLSVIVCSRSQALFETFFKKIETTIGCPYEVIRINNRENSYSITGAYNYGASLAKFSYLCFVHEDVAFKTAGWGKKLLDHFYSEPDAGLVGVAGAVYKSKMPCGWWQAEAGMDEIKRMNIIHTSLAKSSAIEHLFCNPFNEERSAVVVLDGVFMATTKEVWSSNRFDEKMITGFHGYDLDFSFRVLQTKKLFVVYDILLEHYSAGKRDAVWIDTMLLVHAKWKKLLPFVTGRYNLKANTVYSDGWKRLRKSMAVFIQSGKGIPALVRTYNRYFLLLDNKPRIFKLYKDYLVGMIRIIRVALAVKVNEN